MIKYPIALLSLCLIGFAGCKGHSTDAVEKANKSNKHKEVRKHEVADFLVGITDSRLMGIREAEEAVKKGTTDDIKQLGERMLRDEKDLLEKIVALANKRNITLPQDISNAKLGGFKELDEKNGKDFDEKLIKMAEIDHKRDIREFKAASRLKDTGVRDFATQNLPMLESQLAKIKAIKTSQR